MASEVTETNVSTLTDEELIAMIEKQNESKEKRYEANKRWRMNNAEHVKAYHKQYNKDQRDKERMIREEVERRNL